MRISIIKPDSLVIVDGKPLAVDLSFLPENVWAIQVHGETAEVEYTDAPNSHEVSQPWIDQALAAWTEEKTRIETARATAAAAWQNSWERIRTERDALIGASEAAWQIELRRHEEQLRLIALGEPVKLYRSPEWIAASELEVLRYHQALRDIPQTYPEPADVEWPARPSFMDTAPTA